MVTKKSKRLTQEENAKVKKRLKGLWKTAKGDKREFINLVRGDEFLKSVGQDWEDCGHKAQRMGLYKTGDLSPRFWRTKFEKEHPEAQKRLDVVLADSTTSMQKILDDFKEFGIKNDDQLRKYARTKGINIKKGKAETSVSYDRRTAELVQSGILVSGGLDKLLSTLKAEFSSTVKNVTKESLAAQVEEIVWNKKTEEAFRHVVGHGLPLERFSKYHPHIPQNMLKRKAKTLTGLSSVQHPVAFLKGLGRIGDLEGLEDSFELPKSGSANPYPVSVKSDSPKVRVINGANIGLRHRRLIEENPVRRALADATRSGDDVVFIVNPFDIEIKKAAGGLRVLKSFASGLNVNLKLLDPFYKRRLERDHDSNRIIYETVAERFMNMLSGLSKIANRPDGAPEFSGQVFVIFGYKEEEVVANAAAWELGYKTRLKQEEIEAEIKSVRAAIANGEDIGMDLDEELINLVNLKARVIQSDINDEELQKYARKVMHFVVNKIEESIPNAKVIGQGTTFVNVNGNVVDFNVPSHLQVTDGLLSSYNRTHGARSVRQETARTTVICHPYALNYRMASREINVGNKRAEARVFVAPICVDGKFLRDALRDTVRSAHPISKVVFSSQFSPGVLRLRFSQGGIVSAEPIPIEALSRRSSPAKAGKHHSDAKYIWTMVATDPHFGSRNREEVWSHAAKGSLGVSDAVIQMLRDAKLCEGGKLPVHLYTVNDDPTQGNHYDTHKQPHPEQMSYQAMERLMPTLATKEEVMAFALNQFRKRGSDWLQEQIEQVKERHIEPNLDFFSSILHRVVRSGLVIRGVSEIHGVPYDRRDLGAINWGTGNHFASTTDNVTTEGVEYAKHLRALLYAEWQNKKSLVDRLVAAPLEGNQYFAWGIVNVPGGYEWAVEFRSDPARLSTWADPLKAAVTNDALRGDYGLFMTGHKTLKIYGDKHFFAAVNTEHVFYHMCASGTSTDLYGHRGFPPNNTGVSFVGLPADGPEAGPILLRHFHIEHIRKYFEKPYDFDWAEFLPNPV